MNPLTFIFTTCTYVYIKIQVPCGQKIISLDENGAAFEAGMQINETIIYINGHRVTDFSSLEYSVGDGASPLSVETKQGNKYTLIPKGDPPRLGVYITSDYCREE